MKRVNPNLIDVLTARYIRGLRSIRRFTSAWGTEKIGGYEVFTYRKYYYPTMDASTEKLAKMLGVYEELSSSQSGIKSAWLYLNPDKAPTHAAALGDITGILVENLNKAMERAAGRNLTTSAIKGKVVISPKVRKYGRAYQADQVPIVTPESNQEGVILEILENYRDYWADGYNIFTDEADPYVAAILMYVLLSEDVPYTINEVKTTPSGELITGIYAPDWVSGVSGVSWVISVEVPSFTFEPSTDLVHRFETDLKTVNYPAVKQISKQIMASAEVADDEVDDDYYYAYEPLSASISGHWVKVPVAVSNSGRPVYRTCLSTSFLSDPTMKREDKLKYLYACIDQGYTKKKPKWYQVLLAVIIIVVAIIASVWTGGSSLSWGTTVAAVMSGAAVITIAALYVSLALAASALLGHQGVTSALGTFMKHAEPLIRVASVVSVFSIIKNVFTEAAKTAAAEAAKEGVKQTTLRTIQHASIKLAEIAIERVVGFSLTNLSMSNMARMLTSLVVYQDRKNQRDLQKELKSYSKELAELKAADEKNKTSDILKELAFSYPNVLSADKSVYASLYDLPYEWWSTPFHTGCMQANDTQAFWYSRD